ncbi:MAG: preprotein translocase subunit YajC [Alphaproteobacteria bacterium]|nr:preprotein translocase subunit YajC [Alphaproteobacteria bacterium]
MQSALAQDTAPITPPVTTGTATPDGAPGLPPPPTTGELVFQNIMMVMVMVALFFVLFILPQRRRAREHAQMLAALKKGDKVITGGGLVGSVDTLVNDEEIIVDLGNGLKVTALRNTVHAPLETTKTQPANDAKKK